MGAFSGSISYKQFYVEGDLPNDWKEKYLERITHFAFEELTADDERDEAFGWVPVERPLERDFPLARVIFNEYLTLGLRRDAFSISPDRLKAETAAGTREFLADHKSEKLNKTQKEEIARDTKLRLRERALPTMKVIDMSWNLDEKHVRFWNQSPKICELFQGLFEETFQLKLKPANPYINALKSELNEDELEFLTEVEPSHFVHGTVGDFSYLGGQ